MQYLGLQAVASLDRCSEFRVRVSTVCVCVCVRACACVDGRFLCCTHPGIQHGSAFYVHVQTCGKHHTVIHLACPACSCLPICRHHFQCSFVELWRSSMARYSPLKFSMKQPHARKFWGVIWGIRLSRLHTVPK